MKLYNELVCNWSGSQRVTERNLYKGKLPILVEILKLSTLNKTRLNTLWLRFLILYDLSSGYFEVILDKNKGIVYGKIDWDIIEVIRSINSMTSLLVKYGDKDCGKKS